MQKRLLYAYKLLSGSGSIPIQEVCQRFGIPPSKVRYFHSEG